MTCQYLNKRYLFLSPSQRSNLYLRPTRQSQYIGSRILQSNSKSLQSNSKTVDKKENAAMHNLLIDTNILALILLPDNPKKNIRDRITYVVNTAYKVRFISSIEAFIHQLFNFRS